MSRIFDRPALIWTVRIALVIVVSCGVYLFGLLIARFFRWKVIRAMVRADPPRVESVGGEFAGAKAEVKLAQQEASSLDGRVAELEARIERVTTIINARSYGDD